MTEVEAIFNRRAFLKSLVVLASALGLKGALNLLPNSTTGTGGSIPDKMPYRSLGKTGYNVSLFSLGGEATVEMAHRQKDAEEIINRALDLGVNYIDTAAQYGGGGSEKNIGKVMSYRRQEVFLATKSHDRTYDGTMRLFEQSLNRLQTDYIDLYQLHNLRLQSDLNRVFAPGGAVAALKKLKEEGAIRFAGVTGHRDPDVLLRAIGEFDFDCILLSLNAADIHYRPFQKELLKKALEKNMGIIAMKVFARGRILRSSGVDSAKKALDYVFNFPVSTVIAGISSVEELEENVETAVKFQPLSFDEKKRLEELTAHYQEEGNFFKYHW